MGLLTPNKFGARVLAQDVSAPPETARLAGSIPEPWRLPIVLAVLACAEALIAFRQTLFAMITTWYTSRTFSHCILVLPVSICLAWLRRDRLARLRPLLTRWGLVLLGILELGWLLANIAEVKVVQELALVGILICLVWTFFGYHVVRALDFPLAFLFFAVPFGLGLIGPLQDATAWFAVHALTLSGIPAVLEHRLLSVPSATWTVAEACSGIRYLFSSVMLGVVYASVVYQSRKRRLLFVCASVLVPVLANGIRAYGIVVLAYLTNNRLAAGVDHVVYGWLFFAVVQLILFIVGLRWRQTLDRPDAGIPTQAISIGVQSPGARRPALMTAVIAAVLLAAAPLSTKYLWERAVAKAASTIWQEPPVVVSTPWQSVPAYDRSWTPDLPGRSSDFLQSYVSGPHRVDLYWALYSGGPGFELLNSYNRLSSPKLWSVVADDFSDQVIDGKRVQVHRMLLQSGSITRSVWTWYWIDGEFTGSSTRIKFLQAKARLIGTSAATMVLAVATDPPLDNFAADSTLRDFLAHTSFSGGISGVAPKQAP